MIDETNDDGEADVLERPTETPDADKPVATPDAKADTAPKIAPLEWGDDWRDRAIVSLDIKDEKERKRTLDWMAKKNNPAEIIRAGLHADQKISELTRERVKIPTGKNDDPKDIAAFRKTWGVPEKADDYKAEIPKEVGTLSDLDQELLSEFKQNAFEKNYSQGQFDDAVKMYWAVDQRVKAAQEAQRIQRQQANMDEIRSFAGAEYRNNVELANRMFQNDLKQLGYTDNDSQSLMNTQLADGSLLGDHPTFVKWAFMVAKERADDGAFVGSEPADGVDVDSEIRRIVAVRDKDPKEYEALQPQLDRLIAVQNRRKARGR